MIYPWQVNQWEQLWQTRKDQRLPHALLFTGMAGIGKAQFAEHFSRSLLCQQNNSHGDYCGKCHACRLHAGKSHPSILWIAPEKAGQAIKIDQVRAVTEFINHSSLQGDYRIVIINPAHEMNTNAANALLKTLEEPSAGALLILISAQLSQLPATILSRCQRITFTTPNTANALTWLQENLAEKNSTANLLLRLAHGAPLTALQLEQDEMLHARTQAFTALYSLSQQKENPIKAAAALQDIETTHLLDLITSWMLDLIRLQVGVETHVITNIDFVTELTDIQKRSDCASAVKFIEYLQHLRADLVKGINLNKQLMLESLLIRWWQVFDTLAPVKIGGR